MYTAKKVGIIADTHDRLPVIDEAVEILNEEGVDLVLHAGDYVAPFALLRFKPLKAKLIGVFGNNDGDHDLLRKRSDEIGAQIYGKFAEITLNNLRVALIHGEEEILLKSLINANYYDIVIYGHTHKAETYVVGKTLAINPGEACGYLTGQATMMILDVKRLKVETVSLESKPKIQ
ncbi:metallophosphoesterase [Candidatus Bathyarchaeota archaeon]|nr:metallophosphoesterase [Candidatus Bathyarchaeota archaeon]